MCFHGSHERNKEAAGEVKFAIWLEGQGGLEAFGGDEAKARALFSQRGSALTPGPAAPGPRFFGPRIDSDRTGASDLKRLPGRADPRPSSGGGPPPISPPRVPDIPTLPRIPRLPTGGGERRGGRDPFRFNPIPTIEMP